MLGYSNFKSMMRRADNEVAKEKHLREFEERRKNNSAIIVDQGRKAKHEEED